VDFVLYGIPMVAVVIGLVEVLKSQGMPSRYAPVASLTLGLLFAGLAWCQDPTLGQPLEVALWGIVTGLSASGLYSGQKAVRNG